MKKQNTLRTLVGAPLGAITLMLVLFCFLTTCEDGYKPNVKDIRFYQESVKRKNLIGPDNTLKALEVNTSKVTTLIIKCTIPSGVKELSIDVQYPADFLNVIPEFAFEDDPNVINWGSGNIKVDPLDATTDLILQVGAKSTFTDPKSINVTIGTGGDADASADCAVEYGSGGTPPPTYTVTFNKNGGDTEASPTTRTTTAGGTVVLPTEPTRTNYTFAGWYTATSGGTQFTATTPVTANITVYARWTANTPTTCTVTFNGNGGTSSQSTMTVTPGGTISTLPTATRTGYTFNGWYTATSGGTQFTTSTTVSTDTTVYAQWTPDTYTVTFSSPDGTPTSQTKTVTVPATTIDALPTPPTRSGYIFDGWYPTAEGSGTKFTAATPVTADITVYAQWATPGTASITLSFENFSTAELPAFSIFTLYRTTHSGPTSQELELDDPDQYDSISWSIGGASPAVTGTGDTFTLTADTPAYNVTGKKYIVTVIVVKDGVPRSRTVEFTVED